MTIPPDRSPKDNISKIQHSTFNNENENDEYAMHNQRTHGAPKATLYIANRGVHPANGSSRLSNHKPCKGSSVLIKPSSDF